LKGRGVKSVLNLMTKWMWADCRCR